MVISKVSSAVSSAASAVKDVATGGLEVATNLTEGILSGDVFEIDQLKDMARAARDVVTGQRSLGEVVGSALDQLGLPDWAGQMAAVAVNVMSKNPKGALEEGMKLAGRVAEKAGIDRAAEFLEKGASVVGMASKAVGSPGNLKAMVSTGVGASAGDLMGPVAEKLAKGELDTSELLKQATGIGDQLDGAREVASALKSGGSAVGSEGLKMLDDVARNVVGVAVGEGKAQVQEQLGGVMAQAQGVLAGMDQGITDVEQLAHEASTSRSLASVLMEGQARGVEALGPTLAEALSERVGVEPSEGPSVEAMLNEAMVTMRQLVSLAMNHPETMEQLGQLMGEIGEFHGHQQQAGELQYQHLPV